MAASRRGGLVWLLCYASLASFSGFVAAEAHLPLPEIRVDPGVSTEEYDKVKAQKVALEEKVKEIEEKLQEAEQRVREAEQALAEQISKPRPSARMGYILEDILEVRLPAIEDWIFSIQFIYVLALICLVLAILVARAKARDLKSRNIKTRGAKYSHPDQTGKPHIIVFVKCLLYPSGQQIRATLASLIGCLCLVGAITWQLTYIIPIPADPAPVSLIQGIFAMACMVSALAVPICYYNFVCAIQEWLGKNSASIELISNFEFFSVSLAAGSLFLGVLELWLGEKGWVGSFSVYLVSGFGFYFLFFASGLAEEPGDIKRLFEEIKSWIKSKIRSARKRVK